MEETYSIWAVKSANEPGDARLIDAIRYEEPDVNSESGKPGNLLCFSDEATRAIDEALCHGEQIVARIILVDIGEMGGIEVPEQLWSVIKEHSSVLEIYFYGECLPRSPKPDEGSDYSTSFRIVVDDLNMLRLVMKQFPMAVRCSIRAQWNDESKTVICIDYEQIEYEESAMFRLPKSFARIIRHTGLPINCYISVFPATGYDVIRLYGDELACIKQFSNSLDVSFMEELRE